MKIRYLKEFVTATAFSFLLIGGLNQDVFGQGKGHGGGNPHGGGPPPQQQRGGGGNRGGGQPQVRQQPQMRPQPQQQVRQMPQRQQPQFRQLPQMRPQPQPQQQRAYRQPQQVFRPQPQQQQRVFRQPQQQMRVERQPQREFRQPQQQRQVFRQAPGQIRREERAQRQERPQFQNRQMPQQQIMRQQRQDRMSPGQERRLERQQQQAYSPSPVFRNDQGGRGRGNGGNGGGDREQLRMNRMNMSAPWYTTVGRVPPGQIRSAEVHERNAIRQAERADQRMFRESLRYANPYYAPYAPAPMFQYDRGYRDYANYGNYGNYYDYGYSTPYYSAPYYPSYQYYVTQYVYPYDYVDGGYLAYSPLYLPNAYIYEPYTAYATYPDYGYGYAPAYYDNYYSGGYDWKSMLVRTLIGFVLGSSPDNTYYGVEPYDPNYGYGYTQTVYNGDSYYDPYGGSYGGYYPSYQSVEYYQPVYSYSDYDVPLVDTIPMNDIFGPGYGGYSSVTYREVLTQGYEQGYQAGWYARENQLQNDWYQSGYALNSDYVDPYAYSIGENRRCFSEGYALGYQDALSGRQQYFANYTGDTDLVSLLLSNVIGAV